MSRKAMFPAIVLISLCLVTVFLYAGPANRGSILSNSPFGNRSRGDLAGRSLYLVSDFPLTGGGLGAFPGLYSYYMLGAPFFNLANSHNLFLDVAIEQGLIGGLAYLLIFLASIWIAASAVAKTALEDLRLFHWLTLSALIIAMVHGMVDDYLYHANGTMLALAFAGLSMIGNESKVNKDNRKTYRMFGLAALALISLAALNLNKMRSIWYADLGAVQMARVELIGFPTGKWTEGTILPDLADAEASFHASLQFDPANRTANHRLGLISMLRQDFKTAAVHLETAYRQAPNHRGIIKSLGYCYIWLGDLDKAQALLDRIPEVQRELKNYIWWWETQGRPDLSERASTMRSRLDPASQ